MVECQDDSLRVDHCFWRFIYFGKAQLQRDKEREKGKIFHLLLHPPYGCNG